MFRNRHRIRSMRHLRRHLRTHGLPIFQTRILKNLTTVTENATANTETLLTLFSQNATPTLESQLDKNEYVKQIKVVLRPKSLTAGVGLHKIFIFKDDAQEAVSTSSTPCADWEAGAYPPVTATTRARRYKLSYRQWTYPVSGIPVPEMHIKIRLPKRLQRFDQGDAVKMSVVCDASSMAVQYDVRAYSKSFKN